MLIAFPFFFCLPRLLCFFPTCSLPSESIFLSNAGRKSEKKRPQARLALRGFRCKVAAHGGKCGPRPLATTEVPRTVNPYRGKPSQPVLPCHDRSPLSTPACEARWRRPAAESLYVRGFASPAAICSGSVATATAGTVTAARPVDTKAMAKSGARPTGVISKALRDDSIIATINGRIVGAVSSRKKA